MIRQSPNAPNRCRSRAILALALLLANPIFADDTPSQAPADPDWCRCPAIEAAKDDELRDHLLAEARDRQSQCRESLHVDMEKQRKGQGARLDACRCSCLEDEAVPAEGPYGDRKKPSRQGT